MKENGRRLCRIYLNLRYFQHKYCKGVQIPKFLFHDIKYLKNGNERPVETSQLVNTTNQLTGSHMMERGGSTQQMFFIILMFYLNALFNPSSANITKWSNTLKHFIFNANQLRGFYTMEIATLNWLTQWFGLLNIFELFVVPCRLVSHPVL